MERLNSLRHEIDRLDKSLIHVLAERFDVVEAIGECKHVHGIPIHDPERESRLIEGFRSRLGGNAHSDAIERIYRYLMATSREIQSTQPIRIALLGKEGANSHTALGCLVEELPDTCRLSGVEATHFEHAIGMILSGEVDGALLPIENAITGSIPSVYEALAGGNLEIVAETSLEIHHVLAACPGTKFAEVKTVLSHPQALEQCMEFIKDAGMIPEAVESTVHGIDVLLAGERSGTAVITTPEAAAVKGLDILERNISRYARNMTRFVLLMGKGCAPMGVLRNHFKSCETQVSGYEKAWKSMVTMTLPHTCGSLANALNILAKEGHNLVRIESRPIPERPFEYRFFLEIEAKDVLVEDDIMEALQNETMTVSSLGVYPVVVGKLKKHVDVITN